MSAKASKKKQSPAINYQSCYSFLDNDTEIDILQKAVQVLSRKFETLSGAYKKSSKRYATLETKNKRLIAKNEYLTKYIKKTDPKGVIKLLLEIEERCDYLSKRIASYINKETVLTEVSFYLKKFPLTRERCVHNLISALEKEDDTWWRLKHEKTMEQWKNLLLKYDMEKQPKKAKAA